MPRYYDEEYRPRSRRFYGEEDEGYRGPRGLSPRGFAAIDPEYQRDLEERREYGRMGARARWEDEDIQDELERGEYRRAGRYPTGFAALDEEERREYGRRRGLRAPEERWFAEPREYYGRAAGRARWEEDEPERGLYRSESGRRGGLSRWDELEDEDVGYREGRGLGRSRYEEEEDEERYRGPRGSSRRSFASMDPERQREIPSRGGRFPRGYR